MSRCPSCSAEVPAGGSFCSSCGAALGGALDAVATLETQASPAPVQASAITEQQTQAPPTSGGSRPSSAPLAGGLFTPGTMLLERYRMVAPIGKGGMGEVYRADDLKLGQAVALKFLAAKVAGSGEALERLLGEVRTARQVAHPNVCRVFDIGEADGHHFITMELVDGEDLVSLLRRIGRLPNDKALQIARQLCAGLAAAHDRGIIHRDLKPANVMLDGRGHVRITDFGLASLVEEVRSEEHRAGTPTYMAPEQLIGGEVGPRSDVYALGLVLFEIFTGQRAIEVSSLQELLDLHESGSISTPSSILPDIDPAVESVILRCLEKDPERRPASAIAVAAALPGGDPLAAALAAGETPSPELVAAAGAHEGLAPKTALACLVALLITLMAAVLLDGHRLTRYVTLPKSAEVLAARAADLLLELGHDGAVADRAYGFGTDGDRMRRVRAEVDALDRWDVVGARPAAIFFWYRQSPRPLEATSFRGITGRVTRTTPPSTLSGMASVSLEPDGRLRDLRVIPDQVMEPTPGRSGAAARPPLDRLTAAEVRLFAIADLEPTVFRRVESTWLPPVYADYRTAWVGFLDDQRELEVRVEAAALDGRWVYFDLVAPWSRPERMQRPEITAGTRAAQWISLTLLVGLILGGTILARRNLRLGRGDRAGARRIATYSFFVTLVAWVLAADHVPTAVEIGLVFSAIGEALFATALMWVFYVALEPSVRRRSPHQIVSWSRVLVGRMRDPLVGSDILVGALVGAAGILTIAARPTVFAWLGLPPPRPVGVADGLNGITWELSRLLGLHWNAVFNGLAFMVMLVLLRLLVRRAWLANGILFLILTTMSAAGSGDHLALDAVLGAIVIGSWLLVLHRFGLLAMSHTLFFYFVLARGLPPFAAGTWYAGDALIAPILLALYGGWAFVTALGDRPLFRVDD